ncbi:hypothetical protein EVAR_43691_1 [Eumeta japonica]|uniref:Uncharacterized protein n=1 Tax=Eumeta variegata TaxID=151549 RepID=A0A4C1WYF3_EUMVA|nr:hypothetical protein EVAR_43691_1 [Eumeta japonica]
MNAARLFSERAPATAAHECRCAAVRPLPAARGAALDRADRTRPIGEIDARVRRFADAETFRGIVYESGARFIASGKRKGARKTFTCAIYERRGARALRRGVGGRHLATGGPAFFTCDTSPSALLALARSASDFLI